MPNVAIRTHARCRGRRALAIAAAGALSALLVVPGADAHATAGGAGRDAETRTYTLPRGGGVRRGRHCARRSLLRDQLRHRQHLPRRPRRARAPRCSSPTDGWGPASGIKVVGDRLVVARGYGGNVSLYDRTTGALGGQVVGKSTPASRTSTTSPSPPTVTPTSPTPSVRCSTASRRPSSGTLCRSVQDLPVFLDWTGTPFPHIDGGDQRRTASSPRLTASSCSS